MSFHKASSESSDQLQATQFALDLMQLLYKNGKNFVLSPYSLVSALVMLLHGTDGNSREQLVKSLFDAKGTKDDADKHLENFAAVNSANLKKNEATLKMANLLYSHKRLPLNQEYVSTLTSQLRAIGKQLDFADKQTALQTINSDVEKATNGLIAKLLNDISENTVLILVNAIHFKGLWAKPFEKELTNEDGQFHTASGAVVKAPLMFRKEKFPFYFDQATKTKAVQLNYQKEGNIAMVLILPEEGVPLDSFFKTQLTASKLHQILEHLYSHLEVKLTLPRFKLTSTHQLAETLAKIGVHDLFDASKANLGRISSAADLVVSEVIQKAVIEVNESGTEAAAATAVMMVAYCAMIMPQEAEFTANRPFIFALVTQDSPKQVLFMGAVDDPTK